jgi:hypothetical protein
MSLIAFVRPKWHSCGISVMHNDRFSFGTGKVDSQGFWEKPCAECARAHEEQFPEDGKCYPPAKEPGK